MLPLVHPGVSYLGWPVAQQPPYEGTKPLVTVGNVVTTLWVELVLLSIAVWWLDGRSGSWPSNRMQQDR